MKETIPAYLEPQLTSDDLIIGVTFASDDSGYENTTSEIRMNSQKHHSEIGHWSIPKTPWAERVFHLCESMSIDNEITFS